MSRTSPSITLRSAAALAALGCAACSAAPPPPRPRSAVVAVGVEPALDVHLHEKHSSALIAWRQARAQDRVLVHLDAHAGLDWLPDETIARIAAARASEIADLESDPYAIEEASLERFDTTNFLYAAARLGIVKELYWVVPDATFADARLMRRLVGDVLVGRMQMIGLEEAESFRTEGNTIRGELFGLPVTITRLADLPALQEPVLLDVDLDYFTNRSALSPAVEARPWIHPREVIAGLRRRGIRTNLITLSLSTIGGFVPPESRWLARELQDRLRAPERPEGDWEELRMQASRAEEAGDADQASELYRQLLMLRDEDASLWYAMARALERGAHPAEAARARSEAERLDPLLTRAELFEGERRMLNAECEAALGHFERFLERFPRDEFAPYARRGSASCLVRLNRGGEAIEAFRRVVEIAPRDAEARVELGLLLRARGDAPGCLEQLRAARRIAPEVAAYALALGSAYLAQGRLAEGVDEIEAALARRPCYFQARARLATALFEAGRFEEAAGHLRVALVLQPSNPKLAYLAAQLRQRGVAIDTASVHP